MDPRRRRHYAATLLVLTLAGWPLSMLTFARDEPPAVLSLSWLALSLTALDILATTDVRAEDDDDDD